MKHPVDTTQVLRRLVLQKGYSREEINGLDEFDLSMLIDGYSPEEVISLRKIYF